MILFAEAIEEVTKAEATIEYLDPIDSGNLRVTFPFGVVSE